jgi:hypothetical protein
VSSKRTKVCALHLHLLLLLLLLLLLPLLLLCLQAPAGSASEYEAFGVQLASLTTVKPGKRPDLLAAFAGLHRPAEPLAAKVVRQLHVQGWSCYWKPRRAAWHQQQQQQWMAAAAGAAAAADGRPGLSVVAPALDATDFLLAPVEAVMEITVLNSSSSSSAGESAAAGTDSSSSSSSKGGLSCEVFIGASEVAMQLSSQQLVGMARIADDAAVWAKRNKYGRYRPPGWITVLQAVRQRRAHHAYWSSTTGSTVGGTSGTGGTSGSTYSPFTGWEAAAATQEQGGTSQKQAAGSSSSGKGSSSSSSTVVVTGRCGVGAPVTWLQVWQYAVRATLADVRQQRRQQGGGWDMHRRELMARR